MFKITRLDSEGRTVLHAGNGDQRGHFAIDGAGAQPIVSWLLGCHTATESHILAGSVSVATGLGEEQGRQFVENMIAAKVLVPNGDQVTERDHLIKWGRFGWRDAADFHLATFGLRFIPDEVDGVSYADYFARMVEDTESAGAQPPPATVRDGLRLPSPDVEEISTATLDDVLASAEPINRFEGARVTYSEIMPPLRKSFGVQRTVGGLLGPHHLRSYPSGGARHPFEAYVVSKGIDDLPVGVYYFDPISAQVVSVPDHGDAEQIDTACFGKGGILTAGAVIVVTCRWLRHSWKYRYDRSYRMLMLEVGHIVQAINLAMIGHGLNIYHCPSINDRSLRQILAIDDDCAEGPVYALGLGHGGIR
jgi:SagB-type dehydrogenase family enzyme